MTNLKEIRIPFTGFYETSHSHHIDDAIEHYFDLDGDGMPDIELDTDCGECVWWDFPYKDIKNDYLSRYTDALAEKFDIDGLEFKKLDSPRFYNYRNDIAYGEVPLSTMQRIFNDTNIETLKSLIESEFTDHPGFSSNYQNHLYGDPDDLKHHWPKDIDLWDHNQLGTLLGAYLHDCKNVPPNEYLNLFWDVWDDLHTFELVDHYMPKKWEQRLNDCEDSLEKTA